MEGKESMGLPSSGPTNMIPGPGGYGTMHQRNSEATPLPSPSIVHTPAPVRPEVTRSIAGPVVSQDGTRSIPGLVVTSLASSAPSYLNTPPMFTADMSTAIVPHFGGLNASGGVGFTGLSTMKKKRGRPRKYAPDGGIALSVTPLSSMPSSASPSQKRGRGRPPGSGKKQQLAALGELMAGSAGAGFTPHAIIVAAGEDVATRIMSFSQQGPRGICILSANGAISNVTLRQPSISGGTVTYEGRFEILSLSGSFLLTESGGTRSRTGGLSVSLAGPDGRVVGGGVAGMLIAASPVQVVVGSFIHNARKALPKVENVMGMPKTQITGNAALFSPTNEVDVKPDVPESSPLNQSTGATGSSESDSPQAQMIPPQTFSWPTPQVVQEARLNTDIDMSLPGG